MSKFIKAAIALHSLQDAMDCSTVYGVEPYSMHKIHLHYNGLQNIIESLSSILETPEILELNYTNYRGENSNRKLLPINVWHGVSDFHKEQGEQWFLKAYDTEGQKIRDFAIKDFGEPIDSVAE